MPSRRDWFSKCTLGIRRGADYTIEAAAGGAHPQIALLIDMQRVDRVVAETLRVAIIAAVGEETARLRDQED